MKTLKLGGVVVALAVLAGLVLGAPEKEGESLLPSLKKGTPELKSAGTLTFGPEGVLFVADPMAATIFAIDTGDRAAPASADRPKVEGLDEKIAGMLGIDAKQLRVNDLAVNPISGNTYLSVMRGQGPDAKAALVKVDRTGKVGEFALKDVLFAQVSLPNAPAAADKSRPLAVTDMAYVKGRLYVAGLSSEEWKSTLRAIPVPFKEADKGTGIEIFHGNHNKLETASPVRTFVPYDIKGETYLLAAYTCTPLVKIPVADLKPGQKVKGTTIAELGNGNVPLDMIVYNKGGKDYILMANNRRGVMKIPTEGVDTAEAITKGVGGIAGMKYETIASLKGVEHLDRFDKDHAILLVKSDKGLTLETIELP
jgi:hypothetical protein